MRDDDPAPRPAPPPADRRSPSTSPGCPAPPGLGPRVLALALRAPPWTYALLAISGLAAALLLAGFRA